MLVEQEDLGSVPALPKIFSSPRVLVSMEENLEPADQKLFSVTSLRQKKSEQLGTICFFRRFRQPHQILRETGNTGIYLDRTYLILSNGFCKCS